MKQKSVAVEKTEHETESSSEDYDSDDPTAELFRETKRQIAEEKRKSQKSPVTTGYSTPNKQPPKFDEDMNLGGITSLSGGRTRDMSNITCFNGGRRGHTRESCQRPGHARGGAGRGRGRGRR